MPNLRDRALSILELLAHTPPDMALVDIADRLCVPRGAAHRSLADLKAGGYVQQEREGGPYRLTARIVSLAFAYLNGNGISDVAQPVLDRLASTADELVRLAVIDGTRLTWVGKSQRRRPGLLLDPDEGTEVYLPATANGHAWLSCLSDEAALELVAVQGFRREGYGPGAPHSYTSLLAAVARARARGVATVVDAYEPGTSAMAAPVFRGEVPIATLSIAGPTVRLTPQRMDTLVPALLACAAELAELSTGAPMFSRPIAPDRADPRP